MRHGGAVKRHGGSVTHEVVIGDASFPPDLWLTRCGWRFGAARHERCQGGATTCRKCLMKAPDARADCRSGGGPLLPA